MLCLEEVAGMEEGKTRGICPMHELGQGQGQRHREKAAEPSN